jgi:hypothetical protein
MLTGALCGNSLVLASIGARLRRGARSETVIIDPALPDAAEKLSELQPDVVLLDVGTAQFDLVVALWKTPPELLLAGVDLGADRLLILSGQPARALTAVDLIETLTTYTKEKCNDRPAFFPPAAGTLAHNGIVDVICPPVAGLQWSNAD